MDEHSMEMDLYGTIFEGTVYGDQTKSGTKSGGDLDPTKVTLSNKDSLETQQNMERAEVANIKRQENNFVVDGEFSKICLKN